MTARLRMLPWTDLGSIWKTLREVDLGALREDAQQLPRLALVGSNKKTSLLQDSLQKGPHAASQPLTAAPIYNLPLSQDQIRALASYDLRMLLLDKAEQVHEVGLRVLATQPAHMLAVLDAPLSTTLAIGDGFGVEATRAWQPPSLLICPLDDPNAVEGILLPAIVRQLPDQEIALARAYPALRPAVSRKLIQETCLTNATYAFTTGIGEMVPVLTVPLTAADIIILTKNQVLLAYKIALIMGETDSPRQVLPTLGAVVGFGFIWRQLARELVGLIPGWGLLPKVAIAYAGTHVTGRAVYHWYATGEKLQEGDLRALFVEALDTGRSVAHDLATRFRDQREALRERRSGEVVHTLDRSRSIMDAPVHETN